MTYDNSRKHLLRNLCKLGACCVTTSTTRRRVIWTLIIATLLLCLLRLWKNTIIINPCPELDSIHAVRSLKDSIDVYKKLANLPVNKTRSNSETIHATQFDQKCVETAPDDSYRHHYCPLYTILTKPKQICSNDTDLFITIFTSAKDFLSRIVLRTSILSPFIGESRIKYVFVVGRSLSPKTQQKLFSEVEQNDDVVVGNFIDHYDNLTIKSLFMLKLTVAHCSSARFVMKLDDDVLVNIAGVYEQLYNKPYHNAIYGKVVDGAVPIQDPHSKWFTGNYHNRYYPRYVGGPMYILSSDLAAPIYSAAMNQPFLRIEDAFITGICAQHWNISGLRYMCVDDMHQNLNGFSDVKFDAFLSVQPVTLEELHRLWMELV